MGMDTTISSKYKAVVERTLGRRITGIVFLLQGAIFIHIKVVGMQCLLAGENVSQDIVTATE